MTWWAERGKTETEATDREGARERERETREDSLQLLVQIKNLHINWDSADTDRHCRTHPAIVMANTNAHIRIPLVKPTMCSLPLRGTFRNANHVHIKLLYFLTYLYSTPCSFDLHPLRQLRGVFGHLLEHMIWCMITCPFQIL